MRPRLAPMTTRAIARIPLWLGGLLLAGCAWMHQDTQPLAQLPPQQLRLADSLTLARDGWPEAEWWRRYQDAQLNALIERGLQDAPRIAEAHARVESAQSMVGLTQANTGALINFAAAIDRQRVSANGFLGLYSKKVPELGITGPWYTAGTLGVVGSYQFDFWGKNKAMVQSALGAQNASVAEAAATELVLAAEITRVYFNIQTMYAMLDLLKQSLAIENERVAAHRARASRGLEPITLAEQARIHKLELDRQITDLESQVVSLREAMRALIGAGPEDALDLQAVAMNPRVGGVPETLEFELLERRPDLQARHWYVQSSLSRIEAAKAAFYPSFDIKAFFGLNALHLDDLFKGSSRQYNIIPGLSLPLFDSGRLNAQLKSSQTDSNVIIAQYNQAIFEAVREVAQAGIELQSLQKQAEIQQDKVRSATMTFRSESARYRTGLADRIQPREAELPVLFERSVQVVLLGRQIDTEIALTLALGGGYHAAAPEAPESSNDATNAGPTSLLQ